MRFRLVDNVLGYAKAMGEIDGWKVVIRDNVAGLENSKLATRLRQPLVDEKAGWTWEVEV